MMLRVFVDTEAGATIATCTKATKLLRAVPALEGLPYDYLEVSSPGLDRVIKKDRDLERFQGQQVKIRCWSPYRERKNFIGQLGRYTPEAIELIIEEETLTIPRQVIGSIRLWPQV